LAKIALQLSSASASQIRQLNLLKKQAAQFDSVKSALAESALIDKAALASACTILNESARWASLSQRSGSLLQANRSLTALVEAVGIAKTPASSIFGAQMTSAAQILGNAGASSALTASALQIGIGPMLSASLIAQQKLGLLDSASIGDLLGASTTFRRSTAAHLGNLTRSYEQLMAAASTAPTTIDYLPMLTRFAPVEYYRHVNALESITVPRPESGDASAAIDTSLRQSLPSVDEGLRQLDSRLCALLAGAREACTSSNPEASRHVLTSLRELFTQVLHALAPDDDVRSWAQGSEYFHDGRPTRRARLLYISRSINAGAFTKFVENDVSAMLAFLDALNAGTHSVESSLSPVQLNSAVARTESLLVFLLGIREE